VTILASEVAALQEQVLRSLLSGEPLPGGPALTLPDLAFVTARDAVLLLDEHLQGPLTLATGKPLQLVGRAELRAVHARGGTTAYLQFDPPSLASRAVTGKSDRVELTLRARLVTDTTQGELGLSAVQVAFERLGSGWVAQAPRYSAV
jgi:hypothetical protein